MSKRFLILCMSALVAFKHWRGGRPMAMRRALPRWLMISIPCTEPWAGSEGTFTWTYTLNYRDYYNYDVTWRSHL